MRTLFTSLVLLVLTIVLGPIVLIAVLFGVRDREGTVVDVFPRWWARGVLWAGGIKVVLHDAERMTRDSSRIYVCNHTSWFDVVVLTALLSRGRFIGKSEITRVPLFGRAALATRLIPIERENRKAAFESYRVAGDRVKEGVSVVVFPEGSRGESYSLRPFKRGPFVLAAAAGVPIVPVLIHGTREVLPKHSLHLRAGVVDVHFLEPIETTGYTIHDRDELAHISWQRMARALSEVYGIDSADTESDEASRVRGQRSVNALGTA